MNDYGEYLKQDYDYYRGNMPCSWSQFGEDMVCDFLFGPGRKKDGFYVDIGTFQPDTGNNTFMFYQRGWSGICIEPNVELLEVIKAKRPRDMVVNCMITEKTDTNNYYYFQDEFLAPLNSSDAKRGKDLAAFFGTAVLEAEVRSWTIMDFYERYIKGEGREVDLLSIDAEGEEENILLGIDYEVFSPRIVVAELEEMSGDSVRSRTMEFMKSKGYVVAASNFSNCVFAQSDFYADRFGFTREIFSNE